MGDRQSSQTRTSSEPLGPSSSPPAPPTHVELLNEWLIKNGEEAIDWQKLKTNKNYSLEQLCKFKTIFARHSDESFDDNVDTWYAKSLLYDETTHQLKKHFNSCESASEKVRTLTVLPASLSIQKIQEDFDASSRMITKAKVLMAEKGAIASTNRKIGRVLEQTEEKVKHFFYKEDVSKELTGENNVLNVKRGQGKRTKIAKRLVLGNLSELHKEFQKFHPNNPMSFSEFASLRPRQCVLPSSSAMHNVCTIHENVKLMFAAAHLETAVGIDSVTDYLKLLVCSHPTADCYLRKCEHCPSVNELREKLQMAFDEEMVETVSFNQWESSDRCDFITKVSSTGDFIDEFLDKSDVLVTHQFICDKQVTFFNQLKEGLQLNQAIVVVDFAENYTFVVNDSVQGVHFTTKQVTIQPLGVYFKDGNTQELRQVSLAGIPDCADHSSEAFYAVQNKMIEYLKNLVPRLEKVFYFSVGSAQFKNKNHVSNLVYHEKDFDILAEWHFFATGHGRCSDSIGGTIKRMAYLFCLENTDPGRQITTPKTLFEWAESNIGGIHCMWVSSREVADAEMLLDLRFRLAKPIVGIELTHAVLPLLKNYTDSSIDVKRYSAATESKDYYVTTIGFIIDHDPRGMGEDNSKTILIIDPQGNDSEDSDNSDNSDDSDNYDYYDNVYRPSNIEANFIV